MMIFNEPASSEPHYIADRAATAWAPLGFVSFLGGAALAVVLAVCSLSGASHLGATPVGEPGAGSVDSATAHPVAVGTTATQASGWYTRYTLRLKLDMGGEQSVDVMAPPGGLELVVRDMTGDKVPNDVVVTPALLHWPLTVLVNDGHNHFTVAISAKFPDSSASEQDQASGTRGLVDISVLVSGGFEHHALTDRGGWPVPPRQQGILPSTLASATPLDAIASGSGRAPPSLVTSI